MNMAEHGIFASIPSTALRGELRFAEPMAKHVSWRAGGAAARLFKPADLADLQAFLPTLPPEEPILFVGLGSNLLVRDGGFKGTVVLTTPMLHGLLLDPADPAIVCAGAGVASPHVAKFAAKNHFAGAEWLAGVPGTVGGALAMNAGCYGTESWEQVVDCTTIDRGGALHTRTAPDFDIGYRHVAAKFTLYREPKLAGPVVPSLRKYPAAVSLFCRTAPESAPTRGVPGAMVRPVSRPVRGSM